MSELYKVLNADGTPYHGGHGRWHLPTGTRPGRWRPRLQNPTLCQRGYHLCRPGDLVYWIGPALFTAEADGAIITDTTKIVVERARLLTRVETWNDRTLRLFACDCAEHTLDAGEITGPRSREAIRVARAYANGDATAEQLAAARDAAWDAAWAAAWDAAWDAARAAARAAAWDAAGAAAWDAAEAADWDEERAWQTDRLFQYIRGEVPA